MNRRPRFKFELRGRLAALFALSAACVLLVGCSTADSSLDANVWPAEAQNVKQFSGSSIAVGLPGDQEPLAFADSSIWSLADDGFLLEAQVSDDYAIAVKRARSTDPYLDGVQHLGPRVGFVRRGSNMVSDGEGVSQVEDYQELVLLNPQVPSDREAVIRLGGVIRSVQTHESTETAVEAILLEWSPTEASTRALLLLSRDADGSWVTTWSSIGDAATALSAPWAFGFVSGDGSAGTYVSVVGDADAGPSVSPRIIRIGLDGEVHELDNGVLSGIEGVEFLCEYVGNGKQNLAFRSRTSSGEEGLLLIEEAGTSIRAFEPTGRPLLVFGGPSGGVAVLTGPAAGDTGPLRVEALDGGHSAKVAEDSDAKWARLLHPSPDGRRHVALLGTHLLENGDGVWSVSRLSFDRPEGPFEVSSIVDSWCTPNQYWGIASVDEFPADSDQESDAIVLGLFAEDEGALATVPLRAAE